MTPVAQSALELVGNTPLVYLDRLGADLPVRLAAKLEWYNPGGSEKDRAALSIVEHAERAGLLDTETVIIEPTSGNMGLSLAIVCALRGYRLILTMPEFVPAWRVTVLRALGVEVVLTPAQQGMAGAIEKAEELAASLPRVFRPSQFENPANPAAHTRTADEIWADTEGEVSAVVVSVATGGTVSGVGRRLKALKPDVLVVAVQPAASPVLTGNPPGGHAIYGMGPPFVPGVYDATAVDRVVNVTEKDAYTTAVRLMREEGLLSGPSGGAAVAGALQIAREMSASEGPVVVVLPDTIERYVETNALERLQQAVAHLSGER